MILAAGRGERMRPLTDTRPKPLLQVAGKALIVWTIEGLVAGGFTELVINHAHLGHLIESELGDGRAFGASIRYSAETQALETAGGIAQALPLLGDTAFAVVNGDIHCDYDFHHAAVAARRLDQSGDLAHLVLVANPPQHPAGDFSLVGSHLASAGEPRLTFSGIGVYSPRLFEGIRRGDRARLAPLLIQAMDAGRVSGERHDGIWTDVGTPARLAALDASLSETAMQAEPVRQRQEAS